MSTNYSELPREELIRRLQELEAVARSGSDAAVHDTAERLRAVVDTAVEAIMTIDEKGILESFNPAAEKMFGYTAAEIIGRNVSVLMPAPYREQHDRHIQEYCRTGQAKIIGIGREVVGRRKDGTVFPMDLSVGEVHLSRGRVFTGIARDITARKQVEAALRREHVFTSTILETCGALIVVLDRDGRIVRFNRACERATGCSLAEVKGEKFLERFVVPEELHAAQETFESLRDGEGPSELENFIRARDGKRRLIAWSSNALFDEQGAVEFVIGTGIDITERRQLEREILEISDREQRRIGHDLHDGLGQHLTGLELLTETLIRKLKREAPALASSATDISRQIREVITQTRLLSHNLSPVRLEADGLMNALAELAAGTAAMAGIDCRFTCEKPVLMPRADTATHLYRIAQEAVNNALKHARAKQIRISLTEATHRWEMRVEDDGQGFDPDKTKKYGLGLRLMQYRARLLGGRLEVQSSPGGGTRALCTLPRKT